MENEKIDRISEQANTNTKLIEELTKKVELAIKTSNDNASKIEENINKINNNREKIDENTSALDILHTSEANGKRMFYILIAVLIAWVVTIGAFLYYINTTSFEETTEIAEVENENGNANACVGDNCNNGEISYGEGKSN